MHTRMFFDQPPSATATDTPLQKDLRKAIERPWESGRPQHHDEQVERILSRIHRINAGVQHAERELYHADRDATIEQRVAAYAMYLVSLQTAYTSGANALFELCLCDSVPAQVKRNLGIDLEVAIASTRICETMLKARALEVETHATTHKRKHSDEDDEQEESSTTRPISGKSIVTQIVSTPIPNALQMNVTEQEDTLVQ